jgi:hypothetical protein
MDTTFAQFSASHLLARLTRTFSTLTFATQVSPFRAEILFENQEVKIITIDPIRTEPRRYFHGLPLCCPEDNTPQKDLQLVGVTGTDPPKEGAEISVPHFVWCGDASPSFLSLHALFTSYFDWGSSETPQKDFEEAIAWFTKQVNPESVYVRFVRFVLLGEMAFKQQDKRIFTRWMNTDLFEELKWAFDFHQRILDYTKKK